MIFANWIIFLAWVCTTAYACLYFFRKKSLFRKQAALLMFPLAALITFAVVFVFNRGSNVAQLSSSGDLWVLWFQFYFPLAIGNLLNLICVVVLISINLIKKHTKKALLANLHILIVNLLAIYHVIPNMPDA